MKKRNKKKIEDFLIKVNTLTFVAEHDMINAPVLERLVDEFCELVNFLVSDVLIKSES